MLDVVLADDDFDIGWSIGSKCQKHALAAMAGISGDDNAASQHSDSRNWRKSFAASSSHASVSWIRRVRAT